MKKRMLAALLALSLVLSLGAGAFAAEGGDGTLWFTTEDGQTEFASETPATGTMSVTVPEDGTYTITSTIDGPEGLSVTWDSEVLAALAEKWSNFLFNEPVELTAGDYTVTAENATYMSVSLLPVGNPDLPDDIPPAAERVNAYFMYSEGDRPSTYFYADEPTSATMTATVEQDGLYLVDVFAAGDGSLSLTVDGDALAFINQLSVEEEGIDYLIQKVALVELTAGEYTLQIENGYQCSVKMGLTHPLDAVDGVIGEGLYVCQLDEPTTVNYTVMGVDAEANFYGGSADSLSEVGSVWAVNENSDQTVVGFEPGMAVIDFEGGAVTSALVGSTDVDVAALEPIQISANYIDFNDGTVLSTAAVQASGYYLFAANILPLLGSDPVSLITDLPIQLESDIVPDWTFSEGEGTYKLHAVVELTIGDYAVNGVNIGSGDIGVLTPAQMVDSLEGEFAPGGVYMCALSEPATFTMDAADSGDIAFYSGNEGEPLQALTPTADGGTITVDFPAGIAVIDATMS